MKNEHIINALKAVKAKTKGECFNVIFEHIKTFKPSALNQNEIYKWIKVLKYFDVTSMSKTKEDFVYKAISKDKTREILHYLYVNQNKTCVSTDGNRLHLSNTDLEPGYYIKKGIKFIKIYEINEHTFPDYEAIIPDETKINYNILDKPKKIKLEDENFYRIEFKLNDGTKLYLQEKYYKDIVSFNKDFVFKGSHPTRPIICENKKENLKCIIMPMKLK